jgi:hypothetical protein
MIEINKLPEGMIPQNVGEMSFARGVPVSAIATRDEWRVKLPCRHTIVLIEPTHQVFEVHDGVTDGITVNPSIVCPNGDWHGFIVYSRMEAVKEAQHG